MSEKTRKFVETLSREELIELSVITLDELELTECIRFNKDSTPYWIHTGDNLIEVSNKYEKAIEEITNHIKNAVDEIYTIIEHDESKEDFVSEMMGSVSDELELDRMSDILRMGELNDKTLEEQILIYKTTIREIVNMFKNLKGE